MTWKTAIEAQQALASQPPGAPLQDTEAMAFERRELDRLAPHLCDGSQRGVGEYLAGVVDRSGLHEDIVSHAWRTHSGLGAFLAALAE